MIENKIMQEEEIVYTEGKDYFDALFSSIAKAKEEIVLETYIYKEGTVSQKLQEACKAPRRHGVNIKITIDGAGSYRETDEFLEFCNSQGIALKLYHQALTIEKLQNSD